MGLPHSGILKRTIKLQVETDRRQFEVWIGVLERLIATVNRIQSRQRSPLVTGNTLRKPDQVKKTGPENLKFLAKKPQYLKKDLKSGFIRVGTDYYSPVQAIDTKSNNIYDTPENRFLYGVLTRIRQRIRQQKASLRHQARGCNPIVRIQLDNLEKQLSYILHANFTTDLSLIPQLSVNRILQMPPCYQDIYRYFLILMKR